MLEGLGHEAMDLMPGPTLNGIFRILDDDKSGKVSEREIIAFFIKLIDKSPTEGPDADPIQDLGEIEMGFMKPTTAIN